MCANPRSPVSDDVAAIPSFCRERSFRQNYEQIDEAIRRGDESFLRCHIHAVKEKKRSMRSGAKETVEFVSAVNLSGDPLLSVLIAYEKFELAGRLLKDVDDESLLDRNLDGNTALHVAAAVGDKAMEISGLMIRQNRELLFKRNNDHETPLLKAALYGQRRFFWKLHQIFRELYAEDPDDDKPISIIQDIKKDGSNVLHCAIMGNSPRLALEIARSFPHLTTRRNDAAVTPLQLVVTLPAAFKSKMHVDSLDEFIYKWIPLEFGDDGVDTKEPCVDRTSGQHEKDIHHYLQPVVPGHHDEENPQLLRKKRFPQNYSTILDLMKLIMIPARWANLIIYRILKQWYDFQACTDCTVVSLEGRDSYGLVHMSVPMVLQALIFGTEAIPRIAYLEEQKLNHKQTMELVVCLAGDVEYWDFVFKGMTGRPEGTKSFTKRPPYTGDSPAAYSAKKYLIQAPNSSVPNQSPPLVDGPIQSAHVAVSRNSLAPKPRENFDSVSDVDDDEGDDEEDDQLDVDSPKFRHFIRWLCRMARKVKAEDGRKAKEDEAGSRRWFESPLITGAKMGLHEFVEKILEVYPQSANIVDLKGKNILQVAIQLGQDKILDMVAARIAGKNPVLPSRLLYARDDKDNTILHYAAEKTVEEEEADALQMQRELQWFEKVEKLVPKDLQYRRNSEEMTAHERFSEKHKEMVKLAKGQLTDLGKTCAGLVAAFVFASSFSIPGSGAGAGSGDSGIFSKTAFKVFTHAFVFGLSSAATALVLFLSLVTSSYKERDFRRSLPTKFFFAGLSFILALVSLLVAFSCNIFLQIYSGRRIGAKDLIPFVCELTIFPVFTFLVMTYRGSTFGVLSLVRHVWR